MKKIGDITNTADKNGEFTDGNVAAGTPPTQLMGAWFNSVQREILNVLVKAGVPQSATKEDQLIAAIEKLIGSASYLPTGYSYSKVESHLKFQTIGDYVTSTVLNNGLASKFDKTGGSLTGYVAAQKEVSSNFEGALLSLATGDKVRGPHIVARREGTGAVTRHNMPEKSGTFMQHGDYGWGGIVNRDDALNNSTLLTLMKNRSTPTQLLPATGAESGDINVPYSPYAYFRCGDVFFALTASHNGSEVRFVAGTATAHAIYNLYTDRNTSKDPNGFIRTGSATALTTGNIAQGSGTSTLNVMSQKAVTDALASIKTLGDGQSWNDVKASRQLSVNYTNATGRTIAVFASTIPATTGSSLVIYVDGVMVSSSGAGGADSGFTRMSSGYALIPSGSTYQVVANSLDRWAELR
ncbi:MAG: hypothetical protein KA732_20995 [Providencia sp.]|uniref:hypothetical protein n=1 Tax=Providencia sp. TaxID=589 RepID=UPI001B50C2EB|nr:hypothetical protein [Providencia sp.]MBP6083722.1 hypothetical protein [Providencia sp.]